MLTTSNVTAHVAESRDAKAAREGDPKESGPARAARTVHPQPKPDPTGAKMCAVEWNGKQSVVVREDAPKPAIIDARDAIIRVTSSALCGTDLHLYTGAMAGVKSGAIMGHEVVGVVEAVGEGVQLVKPGARVAVACDIACGECWFCEREMFASCDRTNPSASQEEMYGARSAGTIGMPQMMGGYPGGQAEYVRVPLADVNLLELPSPAELSDEKAVMLADILPTAWYGIEMGGVSSEPEHDFVAVWGAGPLGVLAGLCAQYRGARRLVLVDRVPWRLQYAKHVLESSPCATKSTTTPGAAGATMRIDTIDASEHEHVRDAFRDLCRDEPGQGPDVAVDFVGMHYAHTVRHKVETALGMESDSPEVVNDAIACVRKGGVVVIMGAYSGFANHVNLGAIMEKCLTIKSGQVPVQKYWKELLRKVQGGELDPSAIVTHRVPLREAPQAYAKFNAKEEGVVKVVFSVVPSAQAVAGVHAAHPGQVPGQEERKEGT